MRVGLMLAVLMPAILMPAVLVQVARAQVPTTTVQDTVYNAEGQPASGTVLLSWNAFTTAGGGAVPAGSTSVTIGTNGLLTVALAPNAGATPMGSYYTAIFHLSGGTVSRQYWVVPVAVPGGGPAKLAAIQNQVLPTSVAMQTVSKAYVDNAIAAAVTGTPTDASPYVLKAGDTMTGPLVLPADPVSPLQAADKNYVDENVAAIAAGLAQKVSLVPSATQTVAQPAGTQLDVNLLNGELYASQYVSGAGNNGIGNALSGADCTSGCKLQVERTYGSTESLANAELRSGTAVVDSRGGTVAETVENPLAVAGGASLGQTVTQLETISTPQLNVSRPGSGALSAYAMSLTTEALTGGSNLFPENVETPPYFKSTYGVLALEGVYNTQGQHVQLGNQVYCYGVGDCLAGSQTIVSSGGYRDSADEGAHPYDLVVEEDARVFEGACTGGCSTGSTSLTVTASANAGTQGDGRFLIDVNPAKTISTGYISGGGLTIFGTATFSGTSFPVSVFLATAQAATSQANNIAPGTVTLPIETSGEPSGFATSTAALPATSGVACVADVGGGGTIPPDFEMANYTVVDGSHLQLTLNKTHASGAAVAVGGLCGYGLEQKVDTDNGIRQVFPVVGSTSATGLYYSDAGVTLVGNRGAGSTSGYLNFSAAVASISRAGNVVTLTTAGPLPNDVNGLTLTVSGVADPSYNGSFAVTTTGSNSLTYTSSGANSTSSGGAVSFVNGAYALYPMAEVLSVFDPATALVDGSFTLAPNTVAWAAGDAVEQPHYYRQSTFADSELITQYMPRRIGDANAGKIYGGRVGPGVTGWQIVNAAPAGSYLGSGGVYSPPDNAYGISGEWANDFNMIAGDNAVLKVHCKALGCNRWDSAYSLFDMDSAVGEDTLNYAPQNNTATLNLAGATYTFAPSGFTAGTINVGTLNATTITGGLSGAAITSGTVSAARLPLFGPSGTSHAQGIVPDPGATAGATRFLREDGTWNVPAGGGGSGTMAAQNANAVAITGGAMDGVNIGGTTPAAGHFTTGIFGTVPSGILTTSGATSAAQDVTIIVHSDSSAIFFNANETPIAGTMEIGSYNYGTGFLPLEISAATTYFGAAGRGNGNINAAGSVTIGGAAATVGSGQVSYGGTTAAASNCNGGGVLTGVAGCLVVNVAGTTHYVPYF